MELTLFAFFAGFVDAVAGGGGLIQLPALLVLMPGYPIPALLGTNKFSSAFGTAWAVRRYSAKVALQWRLLVFSAVAAFVFSLLGARAVSAADPSFLRPLIIVLLLVVALYTFFNKGMGAIHAPRSFSPWAARALAAVVGGVIGFYDGFFGPGTGSFLIAAFVGLFGFDFLNASASAKIINLATNIAALIIFCGQGDVLYQIAFPMAVMNVAGSSLGSRAAMRRGSSFVRVVFIAVVTVLIAKLAL